MLDQPLCVQLGTATNAIQMARKFLPTENLSTLAQD